MGLENLFFKTITTPKNFPEGYVNGPHCPATEQIRMAADLLQWRIDDNDFCTEIMSSIKESEDLFGKHIESADVTGSPSCTIVFGILNEYFISVREKPNVPNSKRLMSIWRDVIYEKFYSPTSERNNLVKVLDSSSDLTNEEILGKVQEILDQLNVFVGQEGAGYILTPHNCSQAPSSRHIGPLNKESNS